MQMRIVLLGILVVACTSFSVPEKVMRKADKTIAKHLGTEEFNKEFITISEKNLLEVNSAFGSNNFFKLFKKGTFIGYGYIGNAPSKTATYDYLVLFDINFIVTKSSVLVYREEYGGEIGSRRWLTQFDGASMKTPELKYGNEIIPISGATISVQSMIKAMNELLQSISILNNLNAI